ncbi:unnamed protein product [Amaranthus hypochondriacus]
MEAQAAVASLSSSFSVNNGIIPYHFCHRPSMKNTNARIKSPIPFSVRSAAVNCKDNVVTLLDYGAGNVRSLRNAIRLLGFEINDVQPDDILKANRLIFPGVGAFATAMNVLRERGLWCLDLKFVVLKRDEKMVKIVCISGFCSGKSEPSIPYVKYQCTVPIQSVKEYLLKEGIEVRI